MVVLKLPVGIMYVALLENYLHVALKHDLNILSIYFLFVMGYFHVHAY